MRHALVFLGAVALVVAATWPLARHIGHQFHNNTDPSLFSWVMLSVFRNLLAQPTLLLHGRAFYPLGQTLTLAEPLVTPSLVAGPLLALTGNPVLAYNLTLVLLWATSGWAAYAVGRWLTGSDGAALVAMLVFTLAPVRIEYAPEFQMEMAFGLPVAVYAWVRFLEDQRVRHLGAFLLAFWLQAVAVWYFAVILGIGLAALGLQVAALRWTGWRLRTVVALVGGGAVLGAALAPVAAPFFVTRRELGLGRGLGDIDASRYADLVTYLEARESLVWRSHLFASGAETSLFAGGTALGLAVLAAAWVVSGRGRPRGWPEGVATIGAVACLGVALTAAVVGRPIRLGPVHGLFSLAAVLALVGLLAREAVEGGRRWRAGATDRRLTEREWVWLLWGMGFLAFLLSLGPVVHAYGHRLGGGLYAWLYPYLFPLHAIRSPTRFGVLVLLAVALLAALGTKWLEARTTPRGRTALVAVIAILLLTEYASRPAGFVPMGPRPVDALLAGDPADVAVLEWPLGDSRLDADAEFRSIRHGKRVVNGFAGFTLEFPRELAATLSEGSAFLSTEKARTALRTLYPLKYLLVRTGELAPSERGAWRGFRRAPPLPLRFQATVGEIDLYEVEPTPEIGGVLRRLVSYDLVVRRPILRVTVAPRPWDGRARTEEAEEWVDVALNDRSVGRITLPGSGPSTADFRLDFPLRRVQPNAVTLTHRMRRHAAVHFPVGATGVTVPGHLRVLSGGQPYGDVASIQFDGLELAPGSRGYSMVALHQDASASERAVFDAFGDPTACGRLVTWIDRLPDGIVVAGAVKDEASALLCPEGVAGLGRLGVRGDLRGRYRESHAFVGAKGAAPGQALEVLGRHPAMIELGNLPGPRDVELRALDLLPATTSASARAR